jgi:16S rRNA C967 or C1407 C5-methylase (RsmB/RsmF family)
MEAYFAYQGVYDLYWDDETKTYLECTTDEQKSAEAEKWMTTVKRILQASFRIGVDVDPIVRERLEQELEQLVGQEMELQVEEGVTVKLAPAKRIPYVPHAYQLAIDRYTIRKNASLSKLFEWLKIQTQAGFVTRQETVSMIPPIVMDIQSHHQVLVCFACGAITTCYN